MKLTPIANSLSFVKFGNADESVFDDDFFNGLLEDQPDDLVAEPDTVPVEEQAPAAVDPKPEETLTEVPADPQPEAKQEPTAQSEPAKIEPEVKPEQQPQVTQPATEPQQMNLDQIRGELEKAYAISDEQADLLTTDPQKAFPALAAQLHMQVMSQVLNVIQHALPQQIQLVQTRQQEYGQVEGQFKQLYPDLDLAKPDVYEAVKTAANLVGKQFPQMGMDDKVKRVGLLAQSLLGNIPTAASQQAAPAKQAAPKPAPVSPAPARTAAAAIKPNEPTMWDQLLSEVKDED